MELSVLIAQILGLVYVLFGLGLLINGDHYKKAYDELMKNKGFMLYGGMVALIIGFLIVTHHNHWMKDWTILVTIIGWLALIKGGLLILVPKAMLEIAKPFTKNMTFLAVCTLILGGIFGYFGFFA